MSVACPRCDHPVVPGLRFCTFHVPINGFVSGHFDTPPSGCITAEQVRDMKRRAQPHHDTWEGERAFADFYGNVLSRLLTHPGVSSSARAVIEAALE